MLRLLALSLFLLCLWPNSPAFSQGIDEPEYDCQKFYSALDWRTKYRSPVMTARGKIDELITWMKLKHPSAKESLAGLETVKTRDLFPRRAIRNGDGVLEITTNNKEIENYRTLFTEMMNNRVRAGIMPGEVRKGFLAWLKEVDGGPYPKIDPVLFYEKYAKTNLPIYEYFDRRMLEYFKAKHGVSQSSVPQAINALERSPVERAKTRWGARSKAIGMGTLKMAGVGVGAAFSIKLFDKLISSVTDPFSKPLETAINNKVKGKVEDMMGDATAALNWPDKTPELLIRLATLNGEFKSDSFEGLSKPEAQKKFEDHQAALGTVLPEFRNVLLAKDKDFETNWNKLLTENKGNLGILMVGYDNNRRTVDTLKALAKRKGGDPSDEEKEQIKYYEGELNQTENQLGDLITTWMVYKTIRGDKNPIDKSIDKDYQIAKDKYFRAMNPTPLRDKVSDGLDLVIQKIGEWNRGSDKVDKKVPVPDLVTDTKEKAESK
ncbi:MAG: hypothetical protein ACXVBE_10990 [Bdellovibrionota bacterium]